jgi:hypothetical protein
MGDIESKPAYSKARWLSQYRPKHKYPTTKKKEKKEKKNFFREW